VKNVISRTYQSTDYITVAELKSHLRILGNDDDVYLVKLLDACFEYASKYVGYEIRKSTAEYYYTSDDIHIPARLISVTNVKYRDKDGDLQTLATTAYDEILSLSADYGYDVTIINPPTVYAYNWVYKVTVVEGFEKQGASVDISKIFPEDLRHAIYLFAEHLYTQRGSQIVGTIVQPMDWNHEHLLNPYKIREFV
jgi:uncharacterized phiE125 gp8 family phage protein